MRPIKRQDQEATFRRGFLSTLVVAFAFLAQAQGAATEAGERESEGLSRADRIRLREGLTLAEKIQDEVWPDWSRAPFEILLIKKNREYLVNWRREERPQGFESIGIDSVLESEVFARERQFDPGLRATFPAIPPAPTIVIGTAEATGLSSTQWVLTLLHEHFHQLQMSDPDYYAETDALELAGKDSSGMWMLNYPFPYDSEEVGSAFGRLGPALAPVFSEGGKDEEIWKLYSEAARSLDASDYRYLSFQLWQEGVSRFVELRVAEVASARFQASGEFRALEDFQSFAEAAADQRRRNADTLAGFTSSTLAESKRVAFYPIGAALAVVLDRARLGWKARYLKEKFFLEKYLDEPGTHSTVHGDESQRASSASAAR